MLRCVQGSVCSYPGLRPLPLKRQRRNFRIWLPQEIKPISNLALKAPFSPVDPSFGFLLFIFKRQVMKTRKQIMWKIAQASE
jgi:hypothetical protein